MNATLHNNKNKYRIADLFSGCGGMTLGFTQAYNFKPIFAIDNNLPSIQTYKQNFDPKGLHSICSDIEKIIDSNNIPKVDIVIGGPPCQGFSLLNKKRKNDQRRDLWHYYIQFVKHSNANYIVMENVPQLLTSEEFTSIINNLKSLGFRYIIAHVLNAANYGVPQTRQRAIILASKINYISLPIPTHLKPEKIKCLPTEFIRSQILPWNNVKSAISDLPDPIGTEINNTDAPLNLHFGRKPTQVSLERYLAIPKGGNRFDLQKNRPDITPRCWLNKPSGSTDLFGRLWWDRPSLTIRTEFYKPEKGRYLHPSQNRPITHREAARIQSFPDSFSFSGSKIEIAKQIGNAVPPLLAKALAAEVVKSIRSITNEKSINQMIDFYKNVLKEKVFYIYNEKD